MTAVERIVATYYQDPWETVVEGIDLEPLRTAARDHRAVIQDVWDGRPSERLPIVHQPGCRSFRRGEGPDGHDGFVYHDALRDQLQALCDSVAQGYLTIPMVLCDFNTVPVAALLGAELIEDDRLYAKPRFTSRKDIENLEAPDVNSGLVRIMLQETERLRRILPRWMDVGVRLNTGPLSVAAELRGTTELLYDMMEAPSLYHDFLSLVTDVYIAVRQGIHQRAGVSIQDGVVRPDVTVHAPTTGVMICDDTVQLLSPDLFETCAVPYLDRVLERFGGGCLHACGDLMHLCPSLKRMPLLHAVEFGQGDLNDWRAARRMLPDKVLIFWGPPDGERTSYPCAANQLREPRTLMYGGLGTLPPMPIVR